MTYKIAIVGEAWGAEDNMVARIRLTKGFTAMIDSDDYERINALRWCVVIKSPTKAYAMRKDKEGKTVLMHHMVIGRPPVDKEVDHINGNGLDNTKENLRFVSRRENNLNSKRSKEAKIVETHGNRFRVRPFVNGIRVNLGSFSTLEEATKAAKRYKDAI